MSSHNIISLFFIYNFVNAIFKNNCLFSVIVSANGSVVITPAAGTRGSRLRAAGPAV